MWTLPSVAAFSIIIIIIIIIILGISFMQGVYTYIPETNHVPREHCIAAILMLLFMVRILVVPALTPLYLNVSTFRSMCTVPNMAVFCSSLTSWFPGMLLTYFLNDFEMVPVAPIITGITFVFTLYMRCISLVRSLYFRIFSASFYNHISVSWNCNIYQHTCSLFIITNYNVWFVVGNGSVSLHLLIPQYVVCVFCLSGMRWNCVPSHSR